MSACRIFRATPLAALPPMFLAMKARAVSKNLGFGALVVVASMLGSVDHVGVVGWADFEGVSVELTEKVSDPHSVAWVTNK